jgi:hypothetical protein
MTTLPTRLLLTILSLLLVFVGIFYFLNKQPQTAEAWYSSSWLSRRPISVGNTTGGSLSNVDVLITLDTASLISAGKMQSDCDDLRLVDSDDTTLLTYWIEGGCNTSTTQIWARIPSILSVGKTIFAYYKNSGATNGQTSWGGNFITFNNTSSCPSGWTTNTNYDNRFPYGSTTYGTQGGLDTHTHTTLSCGTTGTAMYYTTTNTGTDFPSRDHTHTLYGYPNPEDNIPPYTTVLYCQSNNLSLATSQILLYNQTTPSGWTRYTNMDNRFPRGASSVGTTGGSSSHSFTFTTGASTGGGTGEGGIMTGMFTRSARSHSHSSTTVTSGTANYLPPYYSIVYATINSTGNATNGTIVMVTALPPLGWSRFSALDDRFPYGSSSVGTTGGDTTHTTHAATITTGSSTSPRTTGSGSGYPAVGHEHNHSCNTTSNSGNNIPAYLTTIFAQRLSSQPTTLIGEETYNQLPSATNLKTEGATNPSGVADTTPEFQATFTDSDVGDSGAYYQIQVNTNNTFDGTSMWDSTKIGMGPIGNGSTTPQISYAGTGLSLNGTTYYWRMKVWDQATGESAWSSTAQFTMNASPNTPSTPYCEGTTNPSGVTDASPEFSAIHTDPDADAANYYQIEVNTNNTFTGTSMWDSTKIGIANITSGSRSPDISYGGSALSFTGVTYYWRIKFWDTNNLESSWSAVQQFTTATPSAFSAPINCLIEKSNTNANLNVIWSDTASNEDNFEIQRSVNGGGWSTLSNTLPVDTSSYLDSTVSNGNTYQYQIRSIFTGPIYSNWCTTPSLSLFTTDHTGGFRIY